MWMRWLATLATFGLLLTSTHAAPTAPALAIQIKPLDELFKDVDQIAKLSGDTNNPGLAMFKGMLDGMLGADWKDALDASKPWGAYGVLENDLQKSYGVLLLPAKDQKKFLKLFEKLGIKPEEKNGIYEFVPPGVPIPVFFRFVNGYAHLLISMGSGDEPIKGDLPKLSDLLPATEKGLLAIKIFVNAISADLKKSAILNLEELVKQFPVNDEAAEAQMKEAVDQIKSVIKDGKEFVLRFDFDRTSNDAGVEFTLSANPNTKLAKDLVAYSTKKPGKTFGILGTDSVAGLTFNLPANLPQANKDEQIDAFVNLLEQGLDAIGIDTDEKNLKPLTKILVEALGSDLDATASLRGPVNGKWNFIGGIGVTKGKELEKAVKKFIGTLDKDNQARFKIDGQKVGNFVLHNFTPEGKIPDEVKKILGAKAGWYVAFTDDLLILGFGEPTVELLTPLASIKPAPSPQMELTVSTGKLPALIEVGGKDEKDKKIIAAMKKEFPNGETIKMLYVTVEGGAVAKFRYGTDLGNLMKFIKAMSAGDSK
jgi:hypothetical protein